METLVRPLIRTLLTAHHPGSSSWWFNRIHHSWLREEHSYPENQGVNFALTLARFYRVCVANPKYCRLPLFHFTLIILAMYYSLRKNKTNNVFNSALKVNSWSKLNIMTCIFVHFVWCYFVGFRETCRCDITSDKIRSKALFDRKDTS